MTAVSPLRVPSQTNPLYCKPHQLANPSAKGERVQYEKQEFTEWINRYLQQLSPSARVSDLQEDLADGITLLRFVHQIAFEAPPCIHTRPALYVHRLENTEACLSFLDRLGVDLNGVYAEDVAVGNIKTILALCRAMYIRFEGEIMEDHRCLSPMLSWKHKSPSSTLCASLPSESTWPQFPWKQGEEELHMSYQCSAPEVDETAATETRPDNSIFTVWYKEDMAVIGWIRRLLGLELRDYSEFADGILLCAIVNQLWSSCITQEEVLYSTPLERLEIATETAEHFLGVPRTELDLQAVSVGQGRDTLPWYLLELKAASERVFQEHVAMEEEKNKSRDEEEAVNRMRRHLLRQHSREIASVAPASHPIQETQPTTRRPTPLVKGGRQSAEYTTNVSKMDRSSPTAPWMDEMDRRASQKARQDGRQDRIPEMPRKTKETRRDADRTRLPDQPSTPKSAGHLDHIPATSTSSASPKDETVKAVERLETSLVSLMQEETRESPSSDQGMQHNLLEKQQISSSGAPLVVSNLHPSLMTAPPRSATPSLPKNLPQPNIATFFSPYSMPFVSVERRGPAAKFDNPSRNSSSSVVEDDSLARGKLTSWSDKNVRESQNRDKPSKEPVLPRKPPGNISATMLARLAARSPGGLAGMSSSDSDGD
ncbi:uncharacterized protein LOC119738387 [Patiria miniata]|uniref:Calponin-homology (CH) domain-containing protein n=1 Tax=Patiria miniata TaxID=46514 RepID=A0A914AYG7_PATMI|nr:uncharacterized protein LOC119738387 [Patiria miniata]